MSTNSMDDDIQVAGFSWGVSDSSGFCWCCEIRHNSVVPNGEPHIYLGLVGLLSFRRENLRFREENQRFREEDREQKQLSLREEI